jgi:hypothetical protein
MAKRALDEETDNPLLADDRNYYKVEKVDAGRRENRSPAICRQQSGYSADDLCRRNQTPPAHQANHSAADARVAGVAARKGS